MGRRPRWRYAGVNKPASAPLMLGGFSPTSTNSAAAERRLEREPGKDAALVARPQRPDSIARAVQRYLPLLEKSGRRGSSQRRGEGVPLRTGIDRGSSGAAAKSRCAQNQKDHCSHSTWGVFGL